MEETLVTDERFSQAELQGTEGGEESTDNDLRGWKAWAESGEREAQLDSASEREGRRIRTTLRQSGVHTKDLRMRLPVGGGAWYRPVQCFQAF